DAGREQAKEVFKRPISEDNIEVYYEYACALYEESKISEALIAFQDIVKFDKNYRESRQYLNWLAAIREEIAASAGDTVVGELPLGLVINNRYELLQLIGKGGMGIVYRAADRELNITVALKILRPKYSYDPDFIEMIKREVTLARMLTHPNILKIYDLGRAGNLWFISMEFLEGKELKKVIKEHGHLPIDMIKKTLQQVLSGLEHSHQHNLVHSDIKPHNIFIDDKGNATIVDFGISRAAGFISPDATITGTPEYISPEQIQGDAVTAQSDLYSLGITLYEMATGEMPFSGPDIDTILELQLEMVPPSPNELRADIPSWLNRIIMKLLVKDSRNRYQSAAEVQRDIPVI
ncbi:serine/threonine protein kinase, partial [bacterium]|nr:serine/threonine protein kinase [candidate division CSSED10-310 bacterium]